MTYIPDLHDYSNEPTEVVKDFLSEGRRKAIANEIQAMVDEEFDLLEERADEFISETAARRAEKFLERVLNGDEKAAMSLLGDDTGSSRYRMYCHDAGKAWASMIHGKLNETGEIKMRREIVEAHRDLITSERIKDLESVVKGLEDQIRKQDIEINRLRDRL